MTHPQGGSRSTGRPDKNLKKQEKISEDMPSEPYTAAKLIGPKRSLTTSVTRWAPVVFLCACIGTGVCLFVCVCVNVFLWNFSTERYRLELYPRWRYTCRSEITRLLQSFGFVSTNFDVIAGLLRKVRITRWNLMESKMFLYDFIAHSVPHQSSFDCKSIGWSASTQLGRKEFDEQLIQIESSWRLVH